MLKPNSLPSAVLGGMLFMMCFADTGLADEYGTVNVAGRTYRDVIGTCFLHPFLTDGDVQIYLSDTRGRVSTAGGPAMFFYPGIRRILLNRSPLPIIRSAPNLIQVTMPAGTHDVTIVASPDTVAANLPKGFDGETHAISSLEEFKERAKALKPGEELVIKNGVYSGWWMVVVAGAGTEDKPILIRPETPGGVTFRGRTQIQIQGSHVIFKGFRFDHASPGQLLHVTGEHHRVTQCQFFHCGNPIYTFSYMLRVASRCHRSRVDHCYFTGSKYISIGLSVGNREDVGVDNRFDHNVFRDIFRFWGNAQENILLGGDNGDTEPHCTVEYNLFDHAWGDSEIISSKSSSNIIRYNVAAHCLESEFTLRQGNDVRFEGNVMVNNAGGIRIFGERHVVVNNLFMNLLGYGVSLEVGSKDRLHRIAAQGTLIANNTFINCPIAAISSDRTSADSPFPTKNNRISNNLLVGNTGVLLDISGAVDSHVNRNLFWATGRARTGDIARGAILNDPQVEGSGMTIQPAKNSLVIDKATPLDEVKLDRWKRQRPHGAGSDIGADEVGSGERPSDMIPEIPRAPLLLPELYKKDFVFTVDSTAGNSEIKLADKMITADEKLPEDFVMEWEYLPAEFGSKASLTFSAGTDGGECTISWGGVDRDGVPLGVIALRKGAAEETIADGPDILYNRMTYRDGRRRPDKWQAFTLIKHGGRIWLGLGPPRAYRDVPVIPVLVWEDQDLVDGVPLTGGGVRIEQKGPATWKNVNVWTHGYVGPAPPPEPKEFTGQARGEARIALRWKHGGPGRANTMYEIYRSTAPDFDTSKSNCIARRVRGTCYDDFGVKRNTTYSYRIKARNVFGMTSDCVGVQVAARSGGPLYIHLKASSAQNVKAPLVVHEDPDSGETFLWAPPHAGSPLAAPPTNGLAEFVFHIPRDGPYCIWTSTKADSYSQDSLYVSLDDESVDSYRACSADVQDTWTWREARRVNLATGRHTLRIKHREAGARLTALLVTDDLSFKPSQP